MVTVKETQSSVKTHWTKIFEIDYRPGDNIAITLTSVDGENKVSVDFTTNTEYAHFNLTETQLLDMMSVLQTARQLLLKPPTS